VAASRARSGRAHTGANARGERVSIKRFGQNEIRKRCVKWSTHERKALNLFDNSKAGEAGAVTCVLMQPACEHFERQVQKHYECAVIRARVGDEFSSTWRNGGSAAERDHLRRFTQRLRKRFSFRGAEAIFTVDAKRFPNIARTKPRASSIIEVDAPNPKFSRKAGCKHRLPAGAKPNQHDMAGSRSHHAFVARKRSEDSTDTKNTTPSRREKARCE
jgi:hypothetical protein